MGNLGFGPLNPNLKDIDIACFFGLSLLIESEEYVVSCI
jgi:hypothetical protein